MSAPFLCSRPSLWLNSPPHPPAIKEKTMLLDCVILPSNKTDVYVIWVLSHCFYEHNSKTVVHKYASITYFEKFNRWISNTQHIYEWGYFFALFIGCNFEMNNRNTWKFSIFQFRRKVKYRLKNGVRMVKPHCFMR